MMNCMASQRSCAMHRFKTLPFAGLVIKLSLFILSSLSVTADKQRF